MTIEAATGPRSKLRFHGNGLVRPECVLAHRSGLLFAADWSGPGGVAIIDPSTHEVRRHLAADPDAALKPNAILLEDGGSFLLTRLGDAAGGVFRLYPDGSHEPVLTEVEGRPLPPTNFVALDEAGRLYVTVSTRHVPRHLAAHAGVRDGFIVMLPPDGPARIAADGIGYTNECLFDAAGQRLFVNETFARTTSVYPVHADGTLGAREPFARYGEGIYPDGLALAEDGGIFVVSIISNTVLHVSAGSTVTTLLEDREDARVRLVEAAYQAGSLTRALLDMPHTGPLKNISSIAFGGETMHTAYLGCLLGDRIASFESPIAGAVPAHYGASLAGLSDAGLLP